MNQQEYNEFLNSKKTVVPTFGFKVDESKINPILFPFQRDIVKWALWKGRAAIFADCGLGKTFMQLEWARHVGIETGKPVLVLAPLAVSGQTVSEAKKLGQELEYCRLQTDANGVIDNITNYEMLEKFNLKNYGGIVVDESSILKNFTGKTKQLLIKMVKAVNYRLACTATPAPNDHLELGNHAEFLGVMKSREMIQRWFVNDAMNAGGYRLRQHGANDFWEWVASWAVALRRPSDVGDYDDEGYNLPELKFHPHIVKVDHTRAWNEKTKTGQMSLLLVGNTSATGMHKEKKATLGQRMEMAANITKEAAKDDYVIVWCETNAEADALRKLLPDAVEVRGNEKIDVKRQKLEDFSDGKYKIIITKPKIAAHGLNWQHAGTQVWTSITHKFEPFYQGYKRSHRFGRVGQVDCHIVYAESEGSILANLERKHAAHVHMQDAMVESMKLNGMSIELDTKMRTFADNALCESGDGWKIYHGDSAVGMRNEPDNSVDFIVQSPPFESLYIYSSHVEDLGNSANEKEFYTQYGYILRDENRRLKDGHFKVEHCKDLPLYANRDGAMGLDDFPGRLIKAHEQNGFRLVRWITIWKDPVVEMQRTKNAGLLWSSAFCQRAERARQGMADYALVFQKADSQPDTRVVAAPLAQSVVNRCVDLWSNSGENIQSPYHKTEDGKPIDLMIVDKPIDKIIGQVDSILHWLRDGRNMVARIKDPLDMPVLIAELKPHRLVFHSRIFLTDGTWLIVFRKWVTKMPDDSHVTHDLKLGEHVFCGTMPPTFAADDRDYSIQVWQRYASPVWFDLEGLPAAHDNAWFDIDQTNVLNHRIAREKEDEKHICPLQIDLIEKSILEYTKEGDVVSSSFAGVGSELVTAIKMGRKAIGCELKGSYYNLAVKHLKLAEKEAARITLFDFAEAQT